MTDKAVHAQSGEAIKALRKSLGLSQAAFARQTGVHYAFLSMVENGHRNASIATLAKIAKACGLQLKVVFEPKTV